jgi:hypothetical protein
MRRACERWTEAKDAKGTPLDVLAERATTTADNLGRDLSAAEIETVCAAAVAAHDHAEEQRLAAEGIAGAREEERLAYLRRRQADFRLGLAGAGVIPPRGSR